MFIFLDACFRAGLSPSVFKLPASQSTHDLILRLCT
jgi:hypothetical protein